MRSHNGRAQDPEVARELIALDAALKGDRVDPAHRELADLALTLRGERPRPRSEFAHKLDWLVDNGFQPVEQPGAKTSGRPTSLGRLRPRARRRFGMPLAVGTAASLFLVTTAVLTTGILSEHSSNDRSPTAEVQAPTPRPAGRQPASPGFQGAGKGASRDSAAPAVSGSAESLPGVPSRPGIAPNVRSRKVERAATLTLAPPSDQVEEVADEVIQVTDRYRGFVLRSTVAGGDGSAGGRLDLRIPAARLQPALRDLSSLTHVRSRTQSTEDVTGRYLSRQSHVTEALADRRALLRQLARADTPNETASIRARLRSTNREIAHARASLHRLQNRVSYASVLVELEPDAARSQDEGSTLGDALDAARGVLTTSLAVVIVSLAVLFPLSIVALATWATARRLARARRERVLDHAL